MKKIIAAAAIAGVALTTVGVASASSGQTKTDVCHSHGDGTFDLINVADPAVEKHIEHGDALIGQPVPGQPGFVFDEACGVIPEPVQDEFLRAIAWVDNGDGRYNENDDILVARLRNEGGTATVESNGIPQDTTSSNVLEFPQFNFEPFTNTFHEGALQPIVGGFRMTSTDGNDVFIFQATDEYERYFERDRSEPAFGTPGVFEGFGVTEVIDYVISDGTGISGEIIDCGTASPSLPTEDVTGECDSQREIFDPVGGSNDGSWLEVSIFPLS